MFPHALRPHHRSLRRGRARARFLRGDRRPFAESLESRQLLSIAVSTFDDVVDPGDGVTSLREAIALASGNGIPDTIVLPHEIGGVEGTYTLSLGELMIGDTDPLTIQSDGGPAAIDARGASRVFEVAAGSDLTLQGLTITGGGSVDLGGGLLNSGAVTIADSTFSGNTANVGGGAIFTVDPSSTIITDSTISNNQAAQFGGGISNAGHLEITGSVLAGNTASASNGGGLDTIGDVTIDHTLFQDNQAGGFGGGFANHGVFGAHGTMVVGTTTFSGNTAVANGGGFDNNGVVSLSDSLLDGNHADGFGGGFGNGGTMNVDDCQVVNNTANGNAGGIFNYFADGTFASTMDLTDTIIAGNASNGYGGGVSTWGISTIKGGSIDHNTAAFGGGAIDNFVGSLAISQVPIHDNTAGTNGGGIHSYTATLDVSDSVLSNNTAANDAGGLAVYDGTATVTDSRFENNSAGSGSGGGILSTGMATVVGSTINANSGVGIVIQSSNALVQGNTITGNTGDGVRIDGGSNNTIGTPGAGNTITGNTGAGVTVLSGTGNAIRGDVINSNGGLAIDLGGDGRTPNDPGDGDAGPNGLQNDPTITGFATGATTRVTGTLNSMPNATFTIDIYADSANAATHPGESRRYLGSFPITTDAAGNASFDQTLAAATVAGEVPTATATDPFNNTSEFSDLVPILVTPTSGLFTSESGAKATFNVVLGVKPTAKVTIPLSSSDTTEGTASAATLTFTSANWNVPQVVTVTGVDDSIVDGPIAYTILTGAAVSTDPVFNGKDGPDVQVTNLDNDFPPMQGILPLGSLIYDSTIEGRVAAGSPGGKESYSLLLDPGQKVTVDVIPEGSDLKPTVQIFLSGGSTALGTATAGGAGQEAVLQTVATQGQLGASGPGPKTYVIRVGGADGTTGFFHIRVVLNAALENESHGGTADNTRATAQNLDPSFLPLNGAVTDTPSGASPGRGAVLGRTEFPTVFAADFESGADGFTVDNTAPSSFYQPGLWHLSTGRGNQAGHSATQSFYYGTGEGPDGGGSINIGDTRDHPNPTTGSLTSPFIALPTGGTLLLNYNYVLQTRGFPSFVDFAQLSINDGSGWSLLRSYDRVAESSVWRTSDPVDLSAYAGETVQLRWSFDTVLGPVGRSPEGWYIDDVRIIQQVATPDYYSFSLVAGESATLAVTGLSSGDLTLALEDSTGTTLALGRTGATNVGQAINDFVATKSGTYYVRLTGTNLAGTDYSLVVTRNAEFDTERNDSIATAQDLVSPEVAASRWVMGAVEPAAASLFTTGNDGTELITIDTASGAGHVVGLFGTFQTYTAAFTPDGTLWTIINGFDPARAQLATVDPLTGLATPVGIPDWTGSPLFAMDADAQGNLYAGNWNGTFFSVDKATGQMNPIGSMGFLNTMDFAFDNNGTLWALDDGFNLYTIDPATGTGTFRTAISGLNDFAMGLMVDPRDNTLYATTYSPNSFLYRLDPVSGIATPIGPVGILFPHGGDFAPLAGPKGDYYRISAQGNQTLEIETQTPASGAGEFSNNLDPVVNLYDQSGNLVATNDNGSSDGRNAKLSYKVPKDKGGTYYIQVTASAATPKPTQGEYILTVKAAAGTLPPFQVTTTDPPSGTVLYDAPQQVTVNFNDVVLLPTLQGSDLAIDGVAATGVAPTDGDTAVFSTPLVYAFNGHYYTLTSGAENWAAAEAEAVARGGHLVSIGSQAEQDFLKQTFFSGPDRNNPYWTGFNDLAQEGTFAWTSGEPITYTNWGPGQPDNAGGNENAAVLNTFTDVNDGAWDDLANDQLRVGIIELNALPAGAYVVREGTNMVAIAAGAIKDVQNTPISAYSGSFIIDHTAPRIVSSSIQEGQVLPAGDLTYTVTFSEPIQASSVDASDFALAGHFRGQSYSPDSFGLDATGTVLTVRYVGLPDDQYTLTLFSNPTSFLDRVGLELDGEPTAWPIPTHVTGNGIEGGDFFVDFATDAGPQGLPVPLVPVAPLGSLIYQTPSPATGTIVFVGDTDDFTINVDPGQTLTVLVHPAAGQQATIVVHGPSNALVGSVTGTVPGGDVVLQTVPAAVGGQYTITIGDAAGSLGLYSVELTLNAALENEAHGGASNNDIASAQALDSSFIALAGGASRGAVLGQIDLNYTSTVYTADFESGDQGFTVDNAPPSGSYLDGLWHLSTGRGTQPGHSATTSFYYGTGEGPDGGGSINIGDTRDHPNPTTGTITSPPIALPTGGILTVDFNYVLQTRGFPSDVDFARLSINDGSGWTFLRSFDHVAESSVWRDSDPVDISAYAGRTVQLRWSFDTVRGPVGRSPEGWYVDDVRVRQGSLDDDYSFALQAGQGATIALTSLGGGDVSLTLLAADGTPLALGLAGASNVSELISNFVAPTSGTYSIKVAGDAGARYSLVVTRGAGFEAENNDDSASAQDISGIGGVLGAITPTIGSVTVPSALENVEGNSNNGFPFNSGGAMHYQQIYSAASFPAGGIIDQLRFRRDLFSGPFSPTVFDVQINLGYAATTVSTASASFADNIGPGFVTVFDGLLSLSSSGFGDPNPFDIVIDVASLFNYDPTRGDLLLDIRVRSGAFTSQFDAADFQQQSSTIRIYTSDLSSSTGTVGFGGDGLPYGLVTQFGFSSQGGANEDWYSVSAVAGDHLVLGTTTPSDGTDEFVNLLDPHIELYDPSGTLVASGMALADGRNEQISYTASTPGRYRIRVTCDHNSVGEYDLTVQGATGALPPFQVSATDPADGARVRGPVTQMTVDFNDSVLLSSLQADDLKVDGVPATGLTVVDGNTVIFTLPGGLSEGTHDVAILADAIDDIQGTPIDAFSTSFYNDITPPRIVSSSIQEGASLPAGDLTYTVTFSEPMNAANLDDSDFNLFGSILGVFYTPTSASYDSAGTTLTLHYAGLPEDSYTLVLFSGDGQFEDQVGFDLDGEPPAGPIPPDQSGDGSEGGNFLLHFSLDVGTAPYPTPLIAKPPLGSLIYDPSVPGQISPAGDTDSYTLNLDPGQTLTLVASPGAGPLYGGVGNGSFNHGGLILVNQGTGAGTLIADPVTSGGLSGLEFDPSSGVLFGSTIQGFGSTSTLVRIDPGTGALLSTVGPITNGPGGPGISIGDLALQPGTGVLFGIGSNAGGFGGQLFTIDEATGVATFVGSTGSGPGGGIAFAPDGSLYQTAFNSGFDFTSLNKLNPADGSRISTVPISGYFDGLAIRPSDGVFFATGGSGGDQIFTIDPVTGLVTFLGGTGVGSPSDLAFGPATLAPTLVVQDPNGATIASATAAPGQEAIVQTLPIATGGTYTITVGGTSGTSGRYTLQAILNAAVELESHGGPSNNTPADAQDINASFIDLLKGANRGAVLGRVDSADLYSFSLDAGQAVSLAAKTLDYGSVHLELLDHDGNVVAKGLPAPPVTNGGFETGDFTGWTVATTGSPFIGWTVSTAGAGAGFGMAPTQPQEGLYDAWNGFDGAGPMQYTMDQDVTIPAGTPTATLTWQDRIQWNFLLTGTATQARIYQVQVLDPGTNAVLATLDSFSTGTAIILGDTGWQTHTADLSAFAGSTVRLRFKEDIPESFTGPAQIEFDAIHIDIGATLSATNVDDLISNFVAPDSGTYYVRVTGKPSTSYSLIVTRDAVFDLEPNNSLATAQPLGPVHVALGSVGVPGDPSDFYSFTAAAGETIHLFTATPGDGPGEFGNTLDPRLILHTPDGSTIFGIPLADGRNEEIVFTASVGGTYTVEITAEGGTSGEYVLDPTSLPTSGHQPDPQPSGSAVIAVAATSAGDEADSGMALVTPSGGATSVSSPVAAFSLAPVAAVSQPTASPATSRAVPFRRGAEMPLGIASRGLPLQSAASRSTRSSTRRARPATAARPDADILGTPARQGRAGMWESPEILLPHPFDPGDPSVISVVPGTGETGFVAVRDLRAWDAGLADESPVPASNDQAPPAARELALGSGAVLVALDLALRYHANRVTRPIAWRRRRPD